MSLNSKYASFFYASRYFMNYFSSELVMKYFAIIRTLNISSDIYFQRLRCGGRQGMPTLRKGDKFLGKILATLSLRAA